MTGRVAPWRLCHLALWASLDDRAAHQGDVRQRFARLSRSLRCLGARKVAHGAIWQLADSEVCHLAPPPP
jgi:hypothetical protein